VLEALCAAQCLADMGDCSFVGVCAVVVFSVVPIGCAAMFWSVSYLLFRREFTVCPGNYNGESKDDLR
jgi:hypothetical protein